MSRLVAALGSVALLVAGVVLPITPAVADPVRSCTTSKGVLVVVDLRPFGGRINRGCDATPTTGYDALHEAGFTTEGTQHDGPAFVCRIDGKPTKDQDPCVRTPPASAYWSYWHANAGQRSWSYGTKGATASRPEAGSVDAWVFGATDVGGTSGQPCFSPADARAGRATSCAVKAQPVPTRTTSKTRQATPKPEAQPKRTTSRPASAASTPTRAGTTTTPTRGASGSTVASSAPAAGSSTAAAATSSSVPVIVDASQAAGDRKDAGGGSATPVVLGVGLALVLAAGAGVAMVRRRRSEADGS